MYATCPAHSIVLDLITLISYIWPTVRAPVTVAARSEAWILFARSNIGVVDSNPTQGMDVCVCVVLCAGSGLATGWSPVQRVLRLCIGLRNWKSGQGPKGYRPMEEEKRYELWSSSLCIFRQPPIISYLFSIFLSTLFSNTLSLCSARNISD
jgi:hypothetical protein